MRRVLKIVLVLVPLVSSLGCWKEEPLSPGDSLMMPTAEILASSGFELPENFERFESFKRERFFDGTISIEYEFERPDSMPPYIYSLAEVHPSRSDACLSFKASVLGASIGGLDTVEVTNGFEVGESSRLAIIGDVDDPVGILFGMCKSKKLLFTMIVGFAFDDPNEWQSIFAAPLRALDAHPGL